MRRYSFVLRNFTDQFEGIKMDPNAVVALLKSCAERKDLSTGTKLHTDICRNGTLLKNSFVGNSLVNMYSKCGELEKAQIVFDQLPVKDVVSWNALISGYVQQGHNDEALEFFEKMKHEGPYPNAVTFLCILKACSNARNLPKGKEIHKEIVGKGLLEVTDVLGNALVDMYAKCGELEKAYEVFKKLPFEDSISWNTLIAGYSQHGHGQKALEFFQRMQLSGISCNAVTFSCILKACGSERLLDKGIEFHTQIVAAGLMENDLVIRNTLLHLYARCGALPKIKEIFQNQLKCNMVSWNTLITAYTQFGFEENALSTFGQMQLMGFCPDAITFTSILKACGNLKALVKGREMHTQIINFDSVVSNALLDMYLKCGSFVEAKNVFNELTTSNVVSWNILITGYCQHGYDAETLKCFESMLLVGFLPDVVAFTSAIRASASREYLKRGQYLHAQIDSHMLINNGMVIQNTLIDMYAKAGVLGLAQELFDKLPLRNTVSWNALISGYAQHQCNDEVLSLFDQIQIEGLPPDAVTFICLLNTCGCISALDKGQEVHAITVKVGLIEAEMVLGNVVVDMYAKCGAFTEAHLMLDGLSIWDMVSWNSLLTAYVQQGQDQEAIFCFQRLVHKELTPDIVTFIYILKACGHLGAITMGQTVHAWILEKGLLNSNDVLGNALIDMYAKCGMLDEVKETFDKLSVWSLFSWNALLTCYVHNGLGEEAFKTLCRMHCHGFSPDIFTFVSILKGCSSMGASQKGQELHAQIVKTGLCDDSAVGVGLLDMYVKCYLLAEADTVFDKLLFPNVVSWSLLIETYAQHGNDDMALETFDQIQLSGLSPDVLTYICILKVCCRSGSTVKGQIIHSEITRKGLEVMHNDVGNLLVDMYAKYGMLIDAQNVFEKLSVQDIISWNVLIAGYAQFGKVDIVFQVFYKMIENNQEPNSMTFSILLYACSHTGLLRKAEMLFEIMVTEFGIFPSSEHHGCVVDLFSRAGCFIKAAVVINKMPFTLDCRTWTTILSACQKVENIELGKLAFDHAIQLDVDSATAYVSMSNIYAIVC